MARRSFLPVRREEGGMPGAVGLFRDEFDRLFDQFFSPSLLRLGRPTTQAEWSPDVEVDETEKEYLVTAELPGVGLNEIDVSLMDNRLVIRGEKHEPAAEDEKMQTQWSERYYGSFYRAIPLPEAAETEKIKAVCKNGVLEVHIPKGAGRGEKKIRVEPS